MNKVLFTTPIMKIASVEERYSKKTEKPYIVVKASQYSEKRPIDFMQKKYRNQAITFLCFRETLLGLFEEDNIHIFHGEIEPTWGSTFLHITHLFDEEGKRLLRPQKTIHQDDTEKDWKALLTGLGEKKDLRKQKKKQKEDEDWPCTRECDECEDMDCDEMLPY